MIDYQPYSFKDPEGYITEINNTYFRVIAQQYQQEYDHLMQSGLYQELVTKYLLIPHTELQKADTREDCYKLLMPQQIHCVVYPFEWGFYQWKKMVLNYLEINKIALRYGMILKDASPYNFTFINQECILFDTSSFTFFREPETWKPYRQFCEEILAPFTLMHFNSLQWSRLSGAFITGLPLELVTKELSWKSHLNITCLLHLHWHAKFKNKKGQKAAVKKVSGFSNTQLLSLWQQINDSINSWDIKPDTEKKWENYYAEDIKLPSYLQDKENTVTEWIQNIQPQTTLDIGANTGKFSFIAAKYSKNVLALESDANCADQLYAASNLLEGNNVTIIHADITEPSPALGWANAEKKALRDRLQGDLLLALAVIHHLSIGRNVPLPFIAAEFARITSNYAIIEFIPRQDPQLQTLLENKKDIYSHYTEANFTASFSKYFQLIRMHQCQDSERKLFLWQKK